MQAFSGAGNLRPRNYWPASLLKSLTCSTRVEGYSSDSAQSVVLGIDMMVPDRLSALEAQPGPEDAMEWDGGCVHTRTCDQLAILKVCKRALDGASGESSGGGDRLVGQAHRPVGLLGC